MEVQMKFIEAYKQMHGASNVSDLNSIITLVKNSKDLYAAVGDQFMGQQILANSNIFNFTDAQNLGLNVGRFQSGKFGFMLLGLPAAALAMW
ncbi:Uncharacterised protein, partial [Mycoplasma putrefaciens]